MMIFDVTIIKMLGPASPSSTYLQHAFKTGNDVSFHEGKVDFSVFGKSFVWLLCDNIRYIANLMSRVLKSGEYLFTLHLV